MGSSHGETRITRQAAGEGEAYVPLVTRSHEIWREIEAETGAELLVQCGVLVLAGQGVAANHHGKQDFVRKTIGLAQRFHIAHEVLDAAGIAARFPQFGVTGSEIGYFEPGGGYVRPEACIAAQLKLARGHGAHLRLDTQVVDMQPDGPGATAVTTAGGDRFMADRIVMAAGPWAAGPWTGALAAAPVFQRLRVCRQVLHWFEPEDPAAFAPGRCPVYIWMHGDGPTDYLYGFPIPPGGEGVKIATEQYADATDTDLVRREIEPAEQEDMFAQHVAGRIKGVGPRVLRSSVCMYTVTPDSGFVIDTLPGNERILLASACSGHGFKHSAGLGEAIARRVAEDEPGPGAFSAARLMENA